MQPFLKWAGGKRWLAARLQGKLPAYNRYFEPFLGSGALFFALEPKSAVLADTNKELINCYLGVRNRCAEVIAILRRLPISAEYYYRVRDQLYRRAGPIRRAAYFIYLNKLSWNGLYRVNREGRFNVPVGRIPAVKSSFDYELLRNAQRVLKTAALRCCDFEDAIQSVSDGDFIYLDPPYITTHLRNGFIKYNSKLFKQADGLRLASVAQKLAVRNITVLVSNASHPLIRQQYDGPFHKSEFSRSSLIAGDPSKRQKFAELLASNFEIISEDITTYDTAMDMPQLTVLGIS